MAEVLEYQSGVYPPQVIEDENKRLIYPYIPSDELVEAVNLAIVLNRPLLLQGEPGCGKTKLAQVVAHQLKLPYLCWNIKSTSQAQDGLYQYDNLRRLRDAQLLALNRVTDVKEVERMSNPKTYRTWGKLGEAFQNDQRTVLLIDEIDKADIDFPNDLLLELDEKRFTVPETGEEIEAKQPPIIFITSNQERDLPDAFLRRCLFHYIEFPAQDRLIEIIRARFNVEPDNQLMNVAVERFLELREFLQEEKGESSKKVSTSELIDWFEVLRRNSEDEILAQLDDQLPYLGVLLKSWDDHQRYLRQFAEDEDGDED
ncbi:MoxR family ATPase [Roseofilum sp. BLCC_M91]|uniref:MoxR family ATPase n=1 Tax=Roseofilum halophilum BLCC-M91 TaxID=3022259 RepID=A0ABT7BED4_9CYAN|nr:MoxR family ATPase [Roseofilum halophilum]MDJ1177535.1 MoxR family ATPase [Roseofilum halophilum BLCC-M91]